MSEEFKIFGDARFAFRSDTLDDWNDKNPILLPGEKGVVIGLHEIGDKLENETEKVKYGDGVHHWKDLPWWKGPKGEQGIQGVQGPKGEKGDKGPQGDDYKLSDADKRDIAGMVEVPEVDVSSVASSIKNIVSGGGKSLSINDVSPFVHKCSCKLTSDTYEELVGGGNNTFETTNSSITVDIEGNDGSCLNVVRNENGSIYLNGYTDGRGHFVCHLYNLTPGETYTWSLRDSDGNNPLGDFICFAMDENGEWVSDFYEGTSISHTFTAPQGAVEVIFDYNSWGAHQEDGDAPIDKTVYPQLEKGDTMTAWAPYGGNITENKPHITDFSTVKLYVNGKGYTPTEDGTVTDIISASPTMEITTDNDYVNITDFTYCVDTKKYIDSNSGGADIDLSEYVKNTDYADLDKAGVVIVKDDAYRGIAIKDGVLFLAGTNYAPLSDVFFKKPTLYGVPLTSNNIYKWFRTGMTTNDIELTEEEKASACEWLGAKKSGVGKLIGEITIDNDETRIIAWTECADGSPLDFDDLFIVAEGSADTYRHLAFTTNNEYPSSAYDWSAMSNAQFVAGTTNYITAHYKMIGGHWIELGYTESSNVNGSNVQRNYKIAIAKGTQRCTTSLVVGIGWGHFTSGTKIAVYGR